MKEAGVLINLCAKEQSLGVDKELIKALGLTFPQAYQYAETMEKLALAVREREAADFCVLPFCHTVEGEALGGRIHYGDGSAGPRGAAPICKTAEDVLDLPDIDYSTGRIAEILEACRRLSHRGEAVVLNVSGPLTILNILMDTMDVCRLVMKEGEENIHAKMVFEKLGRELIHYISAAKEAGVTAVSYADAMGAPDIIGPDLARMMAARFTWPFLVQAKKAVPGAPLLILCPRTSLVLTQAGYASWVDKRLPEVMSYGKACLWVAQTGGAGEIAGGLCAKNMKAVLKDATLQMLALRTDD